MWRPLQKRVQILRPQKGRTKVRFADGSEGISPDGGDALSGLRTNAGFVNGGAVLPDGGCALSGLRDKR
ncbi:hypothetical protein AAEY27_16265 [Kosakonia sp. BYX6]|uniref:Uncharacterized protein n=1 Tax=Kosakonia calanthes TaxID=3139408 RepID=A0ABZ3B1M3_9ENTR